MFFHPKNLKGENNNPWFNILLHTQSIVCAIVDSQCLEYLGYNMYSFGFTRLYLDLRFSIGKNFVHVSEIASVQLCSKLIKFLHKNQHTQKILLYLSSVEHFLNIFGWVQQQSNSKPTKK